MPDLTPKLLRAVVEIGTQLRRIADHLTTPTDDAADTPPTTPDNGRRVTSWLPISPELAAQRAETMTMLERYINGQLCRTPETHNWGCGCPTDHSVYNRRAELADAVTAETKRLMERRTTTLRTRAEQAEAQRDKLTDLVRDIVNSFTTARTDGKVIGYQGPTLTPDQFEDWMDRAHDPASDPPAAEEQPLPSINANDVQGFCPACGHGVLMLGEGGHVTCTLIDCPNPSAADELLRSGYSDTPVRTAEEQPDAR